MPGKRPCADAPISSKCHFHGYVRHLFPTMINGSVFMESDALSAKMGIRRETAVVFEDDRFAGAESLLWE